MIIAALDLIKGAMRLANALPSGTTPGGEDGADALNILNQFIDTLSAQRLFMPSLPQISVLWPAGVKTLSIGPDQDIPVARIPVKLWSASFVWNTGSADAAQTPPMQIIDQEQYNLIVYQNWKLQWPSYLYYEVNSDMDGLGEISVWPLPARETRINIRYQRQLLPFPTESSTMDLPPGWAMYFKYALAELMWPEWNGEAMPSALVAKMNKLARDIGIITAQKSHVVSGLTAVAPRYDRGRNGGWPQILTGWRGAGGSW